MKNTILCFICSYRSRRNWTKRKQLLTEKEFRSNYEKYGNTFEVGMGAEAVKKLLMKIDLEQESKLLRDDLKDSTGQKELEQ